MAIVTIDTLGDENIEVYTSKLFEKWKIGDKEKDNGVLLLVVSKDKKIRIEVGYGLEGAIPDGLAGSIIDKSILPYFKQGDFSNGIKEGTIEIVRIIAKEYNVDLGVGKPKSKNEKYIFNSDWSAVFFIILIIILFFPRRRRRGFTIFPPGPFIGGGYGGGRGGDFSGGGGFGGFGGFGGGMSGGGGASRGW